MRNRQFDEGAVKIFFDVIDREAEREMAFGQIGFGAALIWVLLTR